MKPIQSKKHKIGIYEINKISLSCFDDRRFVLDDGNYAFAYFHKELKKLEVKKNLTKRKRFSQIKISAHR